MSMQLGVAQNCIKAMVSPAIADEELGWWWFLDKVLDQGAVEIIVSVTIELLLFVKVWGSMGDLNDSSSVEVLFAIMFEGI